jgi:hypothetical protein
MEPHLAEVFRARGTWQEIVASATGVPESLPEKIKELWEKNLGIAMKQGAPVIPDEFAMAFVDQNFPELLSDEDAPQ